MLRLWHNARCSKSRACLAFLEEKKVPFQLVEYLKPGAIDATAVKAVLSKLQMDNDPKRLMRSKETAYSTHIEGKTLSGDEYVSLLVEFPILIERPIVEGIDRAVIGRPSIEPVQLFLEDEH